MSKKISDFPADTTPASGDLIPTVDVSDTTDHPDGSNKKVTASDLTKALDVVVGDSGSGGTKGLVPAPSSGDAAAGKFLKADGTFSVPGGSGGTVGTTGTPANGNLTKFSGASTITNGDLSGDVTTSGTLATTIAADSVTNTKLADMATQTIKGRTTAGTGDPEDLTATQATAMLDAVVGDSGGGGTKGLVPAPAAGDAAAGKFLKADGTFAVPAAGGTTNPTSTVVPYNNAGTFADSPLSRTDANTIEHSNGTAATSVRYNLYGLKNGANFERMSWYYDSVNSKYVLSSNIGGTGTLRNIELEFGGTAYWRFHTGGTLFGLSNTDSVIAVGQGAASKLAIQFGSSGSGTGLFGEAGPYLSLATNAAARMSVHDFGAVLGSASRLGWSSSNLATTKTDDTAISREAAGRLLIEDGSISHNPRDIKFRTFVGEPVSPAQITADQNNYNPGRQYFQRWSSDASRNVTGLNLSQVGGESHLIVNVGSNNIVIKHEDAASTAANRFLNSTGADITLAANEAVDTVYDNTTGRWRVWKK